MTDIAAIAARCEAATKGPWESDSMRSEGSYGTGEDIHEGFDTYKVTDEKGNVICDAYNSDVGEVHVEYDEDGANAWDEVARRNTDFIAHAREDIPALLTVIATLRTALDPFAKAGALIDQDWADNNVVEIRWPDDWYRVSVGDLRRAATALSALSALSHGEGGARAAGKRSEGGDGE